MYPLQKVKLVACLDDRSSVEGSSAHRSKGSQHLITVCGRRRVIWSPAHGVFGVPEVSHNPHPQNVVAEVTKRSIIDNGASADNCAVAAVDGVASATNPPILPKVRVANVGYRKQRCRPFSHVPAPGGTAGTL